MCHYVLKDFGSVLIFRASQSRLSKTLPVLLFPAVRSICPPIMVRVVILSFFLPICRLTISFIYCILHIYYIYTHTHRSLSHKAKTLQQATTVLHKLHHNYSSDKVLTLLPNSQMPSTQCVSGFDYTTAYASIVNI